MEVRKWVNLNKNIIKMNNLFNTYQLEHQFFFKRSGQEDQGQGQPSWVTQNFIIFKFVLDGIVLEGQIKNYKIF